MVQLARGSRPRRPRTGRLLSLSVVVLLVAAAGVAAAAWWWLHRPLPMRSAVVELSIEPGTSPRDIAEQWVRAGVDTEPALLYEWFRWSGQARRIRAGSYEAPAGTTPVRLLEKMVRGDETLAVVRLGEGWSFRQVRAALAKAESMKAETAALSDAAVMAALGVEGVSPEGRFYPDTYAYSKGTSDLAVLKRAHRAMAERLDAAWRDRAPGIAVRSAEEALTLASIVEKETGVPADRGLVSAVFHNRLRIGMPLQTDPTVIFGLGEAFDGNLRKRDLQTDGPYNTYLRTGLPPTPIALPGKASLLAAVRPENTKAIYFVARGDGSSHFSETLAEHNRAVNVYQRKSAPASSLEAPR